MHSNPKECDMLEKTQVSIMRERALAIAWALSSYTRSGARCANRRWSVDVFRWIWDSIQHDEDWFFRLVGTCWNWTRHNLLKIMFYLKLPDESRIWVLKQGVKVFKLIFGESLTSSSCCCVIPWSFRHFRPWCWRNPRTIISKLCWLNLILQLDG